MQMLDQIFSQLCTLIALNGNANIQSNTCTSSFTAMYKGSQTENDLNNVQKYTEREFYSVIDKRYVYAGAGVGGIINAIKTQEIKFSTPLKPFCDNISMDMMQNNKSYSVNWKWDW